MQRLLGPAWTERSRPPKGYSTRKLAEEALQEILADARRGTGEVAGRRAGATFADAAAEFLRYVEQDHEREPSTVGDYRGVIRSYLLPRFSARDLASITPTEIGAYRDELKAMTRLDGTPRLSNRTIVRHLVVLHAIFKRAARVWGITVNPASRDLVDRPPVRYSGEFRTLAPDEVEEVAAAIERYEAAQGDLDNAAAAGLVRLRSRRSGRAGRVDGRS